VFMFVVGYEMDRDVLRGRRRIAVSVSLSATLLPFALGLVLATYLARNHPVGGNRLGFLLFIAVAMSITAFPVLAHILSERELSRTPMGSLALAAAGFGDLIAWSALAAV